MQITTLRHGQTVENASQIIQGQNDGKLSKLGVKQAEAAAELLSGSKFKAIYSSDLGRCVETANIVHSKMPDVPLFFSKEVRELSYGRYQGKPASSLDWESLPGTMLTKKASGGESWLDLLKRVSNWVSETYKVHPNDHILLVTHGGVIRALRAIAGHVPIEDLFTQVIANCETQEFTVDDSTFNSDLSYLKD